MTWPLIHVHNRMYVTNFAAASVSVIDTNTNTVVSTIPVGSVPRGIAFDPVHDRMYVSNQGSNTVSVINTNTNTVVSTIPVGSSPYGIAFDPVHNRMYVTLITLLLS